jgi:hypothetical protein
VQTRAIGVDGVSDVRGDLEQEDLADLTGEDLG